MSQSHISTPPQSVIQAFGAVCSKFTDLTRTPRAGAIPVWGGTVSQLTYMLRHPIQYHRSLFSMQVEGFRAVANVEALVPWFPLEEMIASLDQYSDSQLKAIKNLSEINVRRKKAMITDNILLKVGGLFGSAYALLEVSNNFVKVHGSELDLVRGLLASPITQLIMGYLFTIFIASFVSLAIQYILLIGPTIVRAQLLDDILLMALEEKRFADRVDRGTNPAQKTDTP